MIRGFPQLDAHTLPEALLWRAREAPEGIACVIASADGDESHTISELLGLAERYAAAFRERARDGEPALVCVCLYLGIHLYAAFVGALLAGQIPAMIAPPSPRMERRKYIDSFLRMLSHMRPDLVVTEGVVLEALETYDPAALSSHALLDVADIEAPPAGTPRPGTLEPPPVPPGSVALLQHSSGTTGLQKGVALSHEATLNQVRSYGRAMELTPDDVIATWLPLYHDMGLIACFVLPLVAGLPIVQLSQFEWVNRPALLLEKIREHRATLCWLPNFAYAFLSRAVRSSQLERIDLRSVRAFVNCSEPVMAASQEEFLRRFAERGAAREQLTACYAMAENVFAVTQSPPGRPPRVDRISREPFEREHRALPATGEPCLELVSNGPTVSGTRVRVVDAEGRPLPERSVGEICVGGNSLFSGYFRRDDLTREVFREGWYLTGDLGYLAEGELYVTGRKKDLIIIQGRNFYPADLEAAVSELEGVIDGRVAAFGDLDTRLGTESLVVVAESEVPEEDRGALELSIRNRISQSFDCTVGRVHVVPRRWMIKSTAGKVARTDNRKKYEALLKS